MTDRIDETLSPAQVVAAGEMALKPCPFCGHPAMWAVSTEDADWEIQCRNQECRLILFGGGRTGREVAVDWNRRIAEDSLLLALRSLMKAFGGVSSFTEQAAWDAAQEAIAKAEGRQ